MLITALQASLESNPYFSAGFGLTIVGAGLALGRQGIIRLSHQLRKRNTSTLEITNRDASFPWVLNLLHQHDRSVLSQTALLPDKHTPKKGFFGRVLSMLHTSKHHVSLNTKVLRQSGDFETVKFEFTPSMGKHIIRYNNTWIIFERERHSQMTFDTPLEIMNLTILGRNPSIFSGILQEAMRLHEASVKNKTLIYTNYGLEWRQFGEPRSKRPLSSVILNGDLAKTILKDATTFIQSHQWYVDRGIPYRRGYLLHGPPGSGKSSFIFALAGELNYNVCVLNLNERGLTDDRLATAMSCIPPRSLVLMEDIDVAFPNRGSIQNPAPKVGDPKFSMNNLTFSGLLNVLDGVIAGEERIIFMTTNHIDRLDSALIRPGRVDLIAEVGAASHEQIQKLFFRFYPESDTQDAKRFADLVSGKELSMASIQGHFMKNRSSAQQAIDRHHDLFAIVKS